MIKYEPMRLSLNPQKTYLIKRISSNQSAMENTCNGNKMKEVLKKSLSHHFPRLNSHSKHLLFTSCFRSVHKLSSLFLLSIFAIISSPPSCRHTARDSEWHISCSSLSDYFRNTAKQNSLPGNWILGKNSLFLQKFHTGRPA